MTRVDVDQDGEPDVSTLWFRVKVEVENKWVELCGPMASAECLRGVGPRRSQVDSATERIQPSRRPVGLGLAFLDREGVRIPGAGWPPRRGSTNLAVAEMSDLSLHHSRGSVNGSIAIK
jgi:hypothetical protein